MGPNIFYVPPPTFIGGRQPYAPALGIPQSGPAASVPPPLSQSNLRILAGSWVRDPTIVISLCSVAPFLTNPAAPDSPPVQTAVNLNSIVRQWYPVPRPLPSLIEVAALLPQPTLPPVSTYVNLNLVIRQWQPPYFPPPRLTISAPLLPAPAAPSNPPVSTRAVLNSILRQWVPPYLPLPRIPISAATQPIAPTSTTIFMRRSRRQFIH